MTAPVDFTACPRVPGRAYNGANGKKICVEFEGARWMLKLGGRKINYADFLANSRDPDLAAARARIVPRIDTAAFARLVSETPYLTDLQRVFYPAYFSARASKLFGI